MSATVTSPYADHLKRRSQRVCSLLRLDLEDGTVLGFTDHDRVLSYDLDGDGSIDYRPDFGMQLSNIQTGTGLDAGNFEVSFPIRRSPRPITRAAVAGGRFHRCEARLVEVIWNDLAAGERKIMFGNSGEWRIEGDKATAEVRDQRDRLNQTTGRQIQNQCDADYADQIECFATPTEANAVVTAVTSATEFTVTPTGGPFADALFNRGTLRFTSGGNAGTRPTPIWSWTAAGAVMLYWPAVEAPQVGDELTLRDGCARTRAACMAHGQILFFRGCPDVPSQKSLKPAIPNSPAGGGKAGGK